MYITLHQDSLFYLLRVDGIGEYAMGDGEGNHCLFAFSGRETVTEFVGRMELPTHLNFIAISYDIPSFTALLRDILPRFGLIAIDPISKFEFAPVHMKDFLNAIAAEF